MTSEPPDCFTPPPAGRPVRRERSPALLRYEHHEAGEPMPSTDYIRHAAKLSRQLFLDASMGTPSTPDPEFYKTLAKALEEIADGLESTAKRRD